MATEQGNPLSRNRSIIDRFGTPKELVTLVIPGLFRCFWTHSSMLIPDCTQSFGSLSNCQVLVSFAVPC
jgi:hypothetical protein